MRAQPLVACLVMGAVLLFQSMARGESAQQAFAKGETLLAKGNLAAALELYAAAARADRGNQDYLQHYAMARRIIEMRNRLETEKDPQQWDYLARALRSFYVSERIYPEALALDQKVHARLNTAASAVMLAESLLAMDQNAEAVKVLSALEPGKTTPGAQAMLGIALVGSGKTDDARQIAGKLVLPKDAGPGLTYTAARLCAATGDSAKALSLLKGCFESLPPSRQAVFKDHAEDCPEFAGLASTAEFTRALETKSKVAESKCSGGSSCAGCPMRGKCPSSQGQSQ